MLVDEMKKRMLAALKSGNSVEKEVLRVAIGEVQTAQARGGAGSDEETVAVVRKLINSNQETLGLSQSAEQKATLAQEIEVLKSYLPQSLSVEQIVEALAPAAAAIKSAGNDGQATGVAMKHLKSTGASVTGKEVSEAVKRIRA